MTVRDGGTTNPALLNRLVDWGDTAAWREFVERYNPLLTTWCRRMRLDAETADELCQRVWIELARRIVSFRYDPSKTFRGWLRRLFYSRTIDLLRARRTDRLQLGEDEPSALLERLNHPADGDEANEESAQPPALLELAKQVQDSVQSHVEPRTWQAFWSIAVEGRSVRETAETLNLSYAAAFAAHKRVVRRLQEAGRAAMRSSGMLGTLSGLDDDGPMDDPDRAAPEEPGDAMPPAF